MTARIHALAGQISPREQLLDVDALLHAYERIAPDPGLAAQRVSFGTSGHRGCAFDGSFNRAHVLAISQAICDYRRTQGIEGPLFLGIDTHAVSAPALVTALSVFAANGVAVRIAPRGEFTPTPAVSLAILNYNRGRQAGLADGVVLTPSHNPPESGGYKYNLTHGGPADTAATRTIEAAANLLLAKAESMVRRIGEADVWQHALVSEHYFLEEYVADLAQTIDFECIRQSSLKIGVDPLGGAGVAYWPRIAEAHGLDMRIVNSAVDPRFAFMTLDWDGRIRMDPSSEFAMRGLIAMRDQFDIAFACDTDHDRHGIVAPSVGLLPANHYLCVASDYLFRHRPQWAASARLGKTLVSSSLIDRVAADLRRTVLEVPVGFKWFVDGLFDGSLGFAGEESAGASFARFDGHVWTTDKDGITLGLLAAEMTAREGLDPGARFDAIAARLGRPLTTRIDAPADSTRKARLASLSPANIHVATLADDAITTVLDRAPGFDAPFGGIKVSTAQGWFAARPSGTEDIYKLYAESFRDQAHLEQIVREAQQIVDAAVGVSG